MKNKITIHIVDDDQGTLNYLVDLLATENYPAKTYSTAQAFLDDYRDDNSIGCLVLDLRLPGINGLELQQQLVSNNIDLPVIMISGFGNIQTAIKALKAGVLDFIEKPFHGKDLLDRVQLAIKKHQAIREKKSAINHAREKIDSLTRREKQVMELVVAGLISKDIATELGISVKTVEVHRANVMDKIKVSSVTDLVRLSILASEDYRDIDPA